MILGYPRFLGFLSTHKSTAARANIGHGSFNSLRCNENSG